MDAGIPLFCAIGRLVDQKGFDMLARAMERLLSWRMQLVLLASGDREAEHHFSSLAARHPDRFRAVLHFDNALAHRLVRRAPTSSSSRRASSPAA